MSKKRILLLVGTVILVIGFITIAMRPQSKEVWHGKSSDIYKDSVATIHAGWKHWWVPYVVMPPQGEAKDFVVNGTITEVDGYQFNFYVFNPINYELWKANRTYTAYLEVKKITTYSFRFYPTKDDCAKLRFVVENLGSQDIIVRLSATLSWKEKP